MGTGRAGRLGTQSAEAAAAYVSNSAANGLLSCWTTLHAAPYAKLAMKALANVMAQWTASARVGGSSYPL